MASIPINVLRYGLPSVPLGFLVYGVIRLSNAGEAVDDAHKGTAVAFASAIVWVAFLLLGAAASRQAKDHKLGWVSMLLGADGRLSTSKTTMWLWTFGVGYALLFAAGIAIFIDPKALLFPANWEDYLVLLGGPFAAGVLSKYALVTKFNNGTISKTVVAGLAQTTALGSPVKPAPAAGAGVAAGGDAPAAPTLTNTASLSDIVNNDDGGLDLVDSQYFLFNLIAFAYAMGVFLSNNFNSSITGDKYLLPAIPSQLLALTGAAAATYVANKSVQKDAPAISTVVPDADVVARTNVLLRGVNLVQEGLDPLVAAAQTSIWVTPGTTVAPSGTPIRVPATSATPSAVSFSLPPGLSGPVGLVVVGPGAVPTGEYTITTK